MKIYPIQTGIVRCKEFQLLGASNILSRLYQLVFTQKWSEWLPIYCWLIEHPEGLILVDTGETSRINEKGYLPAGGLYHKVVQTKIEATEEISHQLTKIGFQTSDVKTIVLTHLHGDHIGGLSHFEHCKIYTSKIEYEFATSKKGAANGYFTKNWPTWFQPELIGFTDEAESNFATSKKITTDGKIVAVPTPGHSIGHLSVLVKTTPYISIIAGDITYNEATLKKRIPDVLLYNKEAQQSVNAMNEYVTNQSCIFLSSHDWNAPEILEKGKVFG